MIWQASYDLTRTWLICYRVSTPTPPWWLQLFWPVALRHFWLLLSVFRLWCWTRWPWLLVPWNDEAGTAWKVFLWSICGNNDTLHWWFWWYSMRDLFQKYSGQFRNTPHAFHSVYSSLGVREYYRFTSLASALNSVYYFQGPDSYLDEERAIKHHLLQLQRSFTGQLARKHGPSRAFGKNFLWSKPLISFKIFQADFVSGACLGAFISTIFYPVNTTKTHMQKTLGGEFQSFLSVFRHLLKERGAWGMFRGVHVNYTRSFMSWGIINMSYSWLLGLLASWSLWSSADEDIDEPWRPAELIT